MPGVESTAFILAGGKSSRMGEDKVFLRLGEKTLLDIACGLAGSVCSNVRIVGDRARFGADAIEDVYPGCGPLGGIHAALSQTETDLNLMLAVDTPFLEAAFLRWMLGEAEKTAAVVTVPQLTAGYQPLCAVYRREFARVAEESLKAGKYKIDALYSRIKTRVINEAELNHLAFDQRMFDNLNTRADFERASRTRS